MIRSPAESISPDSISRLGDFGPQALDDVLVFGSQTHVGFSLRTWIGWLILGRSSA